MPTPPTPFKDRIPKKGHRLVLHFTGKSHEEAAYIFLATLALLEAAGAECQSSGLTIPISLLQNIDPSSDWIEDIENPDDFWYAPA